MSAPAMKLTALLPWFGGKRTMAPTIVGKGMSEAPEVLLLNGPPIERKGGLFDGPG